MLLIGFNNASFDDTRLKRQTETHLQDRNIVRLTENVQFSDLRFMSDMKGKLSEILSRCCGDNHNLELHDALGDCYAMLYVIRAKNISIEEFINCRRNKSYNVVRI